MRIARIILGLAGFSFLFSPHAVYPQIATAPAGDQPAPHRFFAAGVRGHFGNASRVVTGEPYCGVRTSTFVQTLSDGTTINRTTTTKESRDSSGRVYRETQMTSGNASGRTMYAVMDPVNHVTMNWRSDSKQAVVRQMHDFSQSGRWRTAENGDSTAESFQRRGPTPTVEKLGTKTVGGVEATGTRTTMTIPAGSFGNNKPITVTHERWVSSELGITVLETDSDPRTGTRTSTLSDIQRNEPDATLFQVPRDYAVTQR